MGELHQALLSLDPGAFLTHPTGTIRPQDMNLTFPECWHNEIVLPQASLYSNGSQMQIKQPVPAVLGLLL